MTHIRSRFAKSADRLAVRYTASLPFDRRLYRYDIQGSIAHAKMLARQGIISEDESKTIIGGLEAIRGEIEQNRFEFKTELEDIHMAVEARLIEKVGEVGRKLHTARSRNDQVALDLRLFITAAIADTIKAIRNFQRAIIDLAEANQDVIMPGYTHLQVAQPVLLAHHLLAHFEMCERDIARFSDAFKRADVLPLGSGALAGVAYDIDREFLAQELGFSRVSNNSIDAVADRDFVLEYEAAAGICMTHLSRLAEELALWSTAEFDFIEFDDAYATGSSIMPQKKNPDVAELARGKAGRIFGHLMAMLTVVKGLPLAYNRDMQEDKEGLFDTADTLLATLEVFTGMMETAKIKKESMRRAAGRGYILATDLADYLVKKGEAFRTAHETVARLVSYAIKKGKTFEELDIKEYRKFSQRFEEDVYKVTIESSIKARDVIGGTAPRRVKKALAKARRIAGWG